MVPKMTKENSGGGIFILLYILFYLINIFIYLFLFYVNKNIFYYIFLEYITFMYSKCFTHHVS